MRKEKRTRQKQKTQHKHKNDVTTVQQLSTEPSEALLLFVLRKSPHMRHVPFIHNKQPETMNIVRQLNCFLIEQRGCAEFRNTDAETNISRFTSAIFTTNQPTSRFDSSRLVSWEYRGHNRTDALYILVGISFK